MIKFSMILLLATAAAAPSLAAIQDPGQERAERRAERQAERAEQRVVRSSDRQDRGQRAQQAGRVQRAERPERVQRMERRQAIQHQSEQAEGARAQMVEQIRERREARQQRLGSDTVSGWQPRQREVRTIPDTTNPVLAPRHRDGDRADRRDRREYRRDYRNGDYNRWTNHWRNDRRYDWRKHRDRNRSAFRLGFYYDPFGWNYRRFSTGFNLWPAYYSQRYWLNDPWQYRLPPAYGPYRWVRYWDDALLVNIYTGQVVDVIHNFFW